MRHLLLCTILVGCSGSASDDPTDATAIGDDDDVVGDDDDVTDDDPCEPPGEATLTVGLGMTGYEDLPEGSPFPLIHGPQGGFHLEVGLKATNVVQDSGDFLRGELIGRVEALDLEAAAYPYLDMRCVRTHRESYGTLLVLSEGEVRPEELDGQTVVIEATLTDHDGTVVTTSRSFVIEDTE
jgi:hypothetical protein